MSSSAAELDQLDKFVCAITELNHLHETALGKLSTASQKLRCGEQELEKSTKVGLVLERRKDTVLFEIEKAKEAIAAKRQQFASLDESYAAMQKHWENELRLIDERSARMAALRGFAGTVASLETRVRDGIDDAIIEKRRRCGAQESEERRNQLSVKVSAAREILSKLILENTAERKKELEVRVAEVQTVLSNTNEEVHGLTQDVTESRLALGSKQTVRLMVCEDLAGHERAVQGLREEKAELEGEIACLKRKERPW